MRRLIEFKLYTIMILLKQEKFILKLNAKMLLTNQIVGFLNF